MVIFLKVLFTLKENIYLQNMNIKCVFSFFTFFFFFFLFFFFFVFFFVCFVFFVFFCVCSLSPSIINYVYPNFRTTCAMASAWVWTLKRFLQFHPTVMLVVYVTSCFIIIHQNFFPQQFLFLAESVKILVRARACGTMAVAQWRQMRQMPHFWNGKCNLWKAKIFFFFLKICLNSPPLPHFIQTRPTAVGTDRNLCSRWCSWK